MALPTVADLKAYLRIQTTAEDVLLGATLAQAEALSVAYLRRPILLEARTWVLDAPTQATTRAVWRLHVPLYPVADSPTMEIADGDGTVLVDGTDYRADLRTGEIVAAGASPFAAWSYTIDAEVGLEASPDYAALIEPVLSLALLDLASDRWHRRNPAATSEATGGGVSTTYATDGMPARVVAALAPWRLARAR